MNPTPPASDGSTVPQMVPSAYERQEAARKAALRQWDDEQHDKPWPMPPDGYLLDHALKVIEQAFRDGWNAALATQQQAAYGERDTVSLPAVAAQAEICGNMEAPAAPHQEPPQPGDAERLAEYDASTQGGCVLGGTERVCWGPFLRRLLGDAQSARAEGVREGIKKALTVIAAYANDGGHEDGSCASLVEVWNRIRALAALETQEEKPTAPAP